MSNETIVAVFDTAAHADSAVAAIKAAGVPDDAISTHAGTGDGSHGASSQVDARDNGREQGFWANLFGGEPDHDTAVYDRSMTGGSTVVSVKTPESHVARVMEILESHHPVDMDDRAATYGLASPAPAIRDAQPAMPAAPAVPVMPAAKPVMAGIPAGLAAGRDENVLSLAEETLAVGKRVVNRGGTRIRRFVVETPVQQDVSLHSERVVLERHPVTDGRTVADNFTDRTIEMTETAEEAVISKTARVYEEVGLRREASDTVETVRDSVRKEEAEIVQVPSTETAGLNKTTATPLPKRT